MGLRKNDKLEHGLDYFLRDLKADSSTWVHKEITKLFEWQKGYGAFSVSPTAVPAVRNYILNQKEHHRKQDFKSEYIELLLKAGIEFEERFLWRRWLAADSPPRPKLYANQKLRIWLFSFGGFAAISLNDYIISTHRSFVSTN
ncbi:MAG: transposase [Blastocatellia bacterium]|nr:transposase [Blastocatellia bacterium]